LRRTKLKLKSGNFIRNKLELKKKTNVKQSNLNHVETTLNETKKLKNLKITKNTAEKI